MLNEDPGTHLHLGEHARTFHRRSRKNFWLFDLLESGYSFLLSCHCATFEIFLRLDLIAKDILQREATRDFAGFTV